LGWPGQDLWIHRGGERWIPIRGGDAVSCGIYRLFRHALACEGTVHARGARVVVVHAVAVIIETVAGFLSRGAGLAVRRVATRAVARAPAHTALRSYPIIDVAIAVIVLAVADLDDLWIDFRIRIITITTERRVPRQITTAGYGLRCPRLVVPVTVAVGPHRNGRSVLVNLPVAIVVLTVAHLRRPRVDVFVVLVAIAQHRGKASRYIAAHARQDDS
jgi:hypothetical protein